MRVRAGEQPGQFDVFLNGEKVRFCVEANEECGYIVVYEHDTTGRIIVDRARGCAREKLHYGAVRIVRTDVPAPVRPIFAR